MPPATLFFFYMFLVFYQARCCWPSSSWDSALGILSNSVEFQVCCCSSSSSCLNDRCFSTSSARSDACSVLVIPTSHDPLSQLAATFDACSELAATFCFELSHSLVLIDCLMQKLLAFWWSSMHLRDFTACWTNEELFIYVIGVHRPTGGI